MNNILITSISKKVPLIEAVKSAVTRLDESSLVYGGDVNQDCVGRFFCDGFWQMPYFDRLNIRNVVGYCLDHDIKAVIPTRDGELAYLSKDKPYLLENGIHVMVSDIGSVNICLDKLRFYQVLADSDYPVIFTSNTIDDIQSDTFVVKDCYGAGSSSVGIQLSKREALEHAKGITFPVFQPFISGDEASVDLYIDRSGRAKGCVARRRDVVVRGESQITTTFRNEKLEKMCSRAAEDLGLYGHVMFQVIIDQAGDFHIVECNCRFGGASTLSVAAGLDSFYWFLLEASGESLDVHPFVRSEQEKRLVRHPEDLIL